jgi:hypothetical protein
MIATKARTSKWLGKALRPTEAMFVSLDIRSIRLALERGWGGDFGGEAG